MGDKQRKGGASGAHRVGSQEEQTEQARALYSLRVHVGDELRRRQMGQPCSVRELAEASGLTQPTLSTWGGNATSEEIEGGTARARRIMRPATMESLYRRVQAWISGEPAIHNGIEEDDQNF